MSFAGYGNIARVNELAIDVIPDEQVVDNTIAIDELEASVTGDVQGPTTSTLKGVPVWHDITGTLLEDSNVLIVSDVVQSDGLLVRSKVGGGSVKVQAADASAIDQVLTYPVGAGTVNQVLTTDGTGQLDWTGGGSGPVSGPTTATIVDTVATWGDTTGTELKSTDVTVVGVPLPLKLFK